MLRRQFRRYSDEEIAERPGFNLDLWADLKDASVDDPADLPEPAVIAEEIVKHLVAALEQFEAVAVELPGLTALERVPVVHNLFR